MKIRHLVITALFTAAICVMAPFSVPIGPIPITLETLGVYLAAGLLGAKLGTLSVTLYIILGALGVPVFAGFSGGFHKLAGVTGGYIVGYILCALIAGALMRRLRYRPWAIALALVLGTAVLYAFGTAWYILQTGTALMKIFLQKGAQKKSPAGDSTDGFSSPSQYIRRIRSRAYFRS